LDTKDKELGKDSHSSVPNLLKVQGTSNTTAHGELPTRVQPSRPFNWHRLSWTHLPTIGNNTQQDNNKGLHCYFCLFCDKGCVMNPNFEKELLNRKICKTRKTWKPFAWCNEETICV